MTTTQDISNAVHRLVDGFSAIPADWAQHVAEKVEGDAIAVPMWGTLFKVEDSCDRRGIEKLMRPMGPRGCETVEDLIEWVKDHGIDYDIAPLQALAEAAEDDDDDLQDHIDRVEDQWRDSLDDDAILACYGWQEVGDTGILARELDGELLLGINGAGYSFFDSHWLRLYQALGYSWHE